MSEQRESIEVRCGYMNTAHEPESIYHRAAEDLAGVDFDTICGRGMSGALVIPRLADFLGKLWMVVRKPTENAHTDLEGEGTIGRRWLFVDDFISTGDTYWQTYKAVHSLATRKRWDTEHVGTWTYAGSPYQTAEQSSWLLDKFRPAKKPEPDFVPPNPCADPSLVRSESPASVTAEVQDSLVFEVPKLSDDLFYTVGRPRANTLAKITVAD